MQMSMKQDKSKIRFFNKESMGKTVQKLHPYYDNIRLLQSSLTETDL